MTLIISYKAKKSHNILKIIQYIENAYIKHICRRSQVSMDFHFELHKKPPKKIGQREILLNANVV